MEENEFGEVTVKKSKKPKKRTKDQKEIVEIIEEEEQTRKVIKKKLAAHKPTEDEEINEEETAQTLQPFEAKRQQEIILETPAVLSETVPTRQVPEIFSQPAETQRTDISIIPLTAISEEQVQAEEKEQQYKETVPIELTAKKSFSTSEAYQVSEETIQSTPSAFDSTFQPTYSKASRNVTSTESISVTEVHDSQSTADVQKEKIPEDMASVKFTLQEAASITETEAINKEASLKETALPKSSTATETYKTSESISVEQIQDLSTTEALITDKMTAVTSKVNIDALEPLVVQEIYTDTKPGKHLPEAFVPTEFASAKFIPQKQIVASETIAPEMEGDFIPGRLTPSQLAGIDITVAEGLQTQQVQTDDKESTFDISMPETTTAFSELILSEGITVSTTDSQMPSKELTTQKADEQKAEIEFLPEQSVTTSTVVASESGKEYVPGELPQSRTADTQITCLEVGGVSDVVVQEAEESLVQDTKPTMGIAEKSIKPVIPLQVSEVKTGDVPEDFTNYPKYKTQEVTVQFETQDATQITETQAAETEVKYEKTTVESFTLSSSMADVQEELAVTETKSMEKETQLPDFELPSGYKGKQVPSHAFPTSTTEEITAQISTSHLSTDVPESKTVSVTHTTVDETVISQTIAADSLGMYKEAEQIEGKQADVSVITNEGINVTEVVSDDKEKDYLSKESPKQYQATVDIDSRKAAHTEEVQPNFLPEEMQPERPQQGQAKPQSVLAEGVQILQHETAEKENEYKADVLPETKRPTYDIETTMNELNVSETYVQESEGEYVSEKPPGGVLATHNIATQEVAVKSQTEMISHTDEMPDDEPITGKAKKYARPLQELIVTEPTPVDFHKDLPKDIFPYEKKANVDLIPGQQLTVTEITPHEREETLEDDAKPSPKQASASVPTREVALQEETLSHVQPDEFKYTSPATDTATPQRDVTHHITQLQMTVGEKESEYVADIKPESKFSNVQFEEGKSITVVEVQPEDKEASLEKPTEPSLAQGKTEFIPCTVAVKSEVATDDSFTNIETAVPKTTEANIQQTFLEGLIQTETKVQEDESPFTETLPETRNAVSNILLGETITTSSIITADKEKPLEALELPAPSSARFDITGQTIAQTSEVHTSDTLESIDTKTAQEAVAKTSHIEQYSITQSELTAGEVEDVLPKDIIPDQKVAELNIDAISAATTQQVVTNEKEKIMSESDKPDTKHADANIDAQPVAETSETVVQSTVTDVEITDHDTRKASVMQTTFESIVESAVTVGETETVFEKAEIPSKKAIINFNEGKSVDVTEITAADREELYVTDTKPTTQVALTQIDTVEALQKQEVPVHEDAGALKLVQPKTSVAEPYVQPFNAVIGSESISQESETNLKQDAKIDSKTAVLSILEDYPVTIELVQTAIKESALDKLEIPETKHVETEMIDLKSVATQFEVHSDVNTIDITDKPLTGVNANVENIPLESITQLQPLIGETESDLPDYEKPDFHKGLINLEAWKSLEVSQVTVGDSSEEYKAPVPLSQKVADVGVDSELQVTQIEATLVQEAFDVLQPKQPEGVTAKTTSSLLTSLTVSENIVHESDKEFLEKMVAPSSQADILLEPGKPVQNTTEIITQERETDLSDVPSAKEKKASIDFDTHKVAETTEVTLHAATDEFEEKRPGQNVANVQTTEMEYLIQQQPEVCEKEAETDVSLKTVTKSADISVQEISSLSVSEIRTTEKEKELASFEMPQSAQAERQILEEKATEISEVQSSFSITDLTKDTYPQYSANIKQDYLEGITNTEPVLVESEKSIADKFTPDTKQADISVSEMSSVTIQETYTEGGQEEFLAPKKDSERAKEGYSPLQSLEATCVIASEDVSQVDITTTAPSFVNIEQTTLDSIALSENIIHEKETELEPFKMFDTKTATTVLEEKQTLGITEVLVQEKEDSYSAPKKAESFSATFNFVPQQSLQQQEIEAESALGDFKIQKPTVDEAKALQAHLEALQISEDVLHESEIKFDTKVPDKRTADIEFLTQQHISVSETEVQAQETDLEKQNIKSEATAEQSILPQSAVQVAQTVSDQSLSDLIYQSPSELHPTATNIPHENVVITDLIIGEKEGSLQEYKTPKPEMASADLSMVGQVASTTEITPDLKESTIPDYKAPLELVTVNILKQTPIEETEINSSYGLEQLLPDESTPQRKATPKQSTLEGITQTEVAVQEKAKNIETEYEESKTAALSIVMSEGISITEVHAEEQEADKVLIGKATEKSAQPEVQGRNVAITEETVAFQSPDTTPDNLRVSEVKAKEIGPAVQYGLVVSERRSTGELESVPNVQKPDSKKGRVLYEDASTTPLISEIQLQEKEGKYFITTFYMGDMTN